MTFHKNNYHAHRYRYPIFGKNAKKGNSSKRFPLMITLKYNLTEISDGGDVLENL